MSQQGELQRDAKPVPLFPADADDLNVRRLECVKPRQLIPVVGYADELLTFSIGQ
jgi:hypothetical protein